FWGEFPAILSAYQPAAGLSLVTFRVYMAVAAVGTVFAAGYLLWMLQRVAFGVVRDEFEHAHIHDLHVPEYLAWAPLLILVVELGARNHHASMVGGAYVVDDFSLVFKGLFLAVGYVVMLMSANYVEEGDYYQGEFYFLVLCSLLGMVVMGSSRDLISIFVALETLSLPAYMLAGWR